MAIITLTTDMGNKDFYVAAVKGTIYSLKPDAKVVDISHHIQPFDIAQASFVLRNSYHHFPEGTVHIIGVNPDRVDRRDPFDSRDEIKHLLAYYKGHYFIAADNGIFSLLFEERPEKVFEITVDTGDNPFSFPVRSVFAKVACMIHSGLGPEDIGLPFEEYQERAIFRPVVESDMIKGTVIYIDTYGNVITNISRDTFENTRKGRSFKIYYRREEYEIDAISQSYSDVPQGEKVAIFSSSGFLEIAINMGVEGSGGGASSLFGLKLNDTVRVEFY